MKPWFPLLGFSLTLLLGISGQTAAKPSVGNAAELRTAVVQTPNGPLTITEQRFAGTSGRYPWDLHLAQEVSEELLATNRSGPVPTGPLAIALVNTVLSRFDYTLKPRGADEGQGYDLYRSGEVLRTEVRPVRPHPVQNDAGDDFALVLLTRGEPILLRRLGLVKGAWAREIPPVFVGKDLVALQVQYPSGLISSGRPIPWSVWREGKPVFTLQVAEDGANPKVKRLAVWGERWVLEVDGEIYIDGSALAPALGARRVYEWRLIQGRPFFFLETGTHVRPAYDGTPLPSYDEVLHYGCCEPARYNPQATSMSVSFWGRRGTDWYFVLIEAPSR